MPRNMSFALTTEQIVIAYDHFNDCNYLSTDYKSLADFFDNVNKCINGGNKITFSVRAGE